MPDKHLVFLSYDGLSDPLGEAQVLPYIKGLAALGWKYTLISFEKPELFQQHRSRLEQECLAAEIDWQPLPYTKKPPVLSTLYDQWMLRRHLRALYRRRPFHLLHCRGYITAREGLHWQSKGVLFLFDMRGFFPDERADAGLWKKNHPIFGAVYRYFKRQELAFLSRADHIISLTEKGLSIMQAMLPSQGLSLKPCTVIPCCADLDLFDPNALPENTRTAWRQARNLPETAPLLLYVGSLGTWYMLNEMLDFFREFLSLEPQARFVLATRDSADSVFSSARQRGIPQERIHVESFARKDLPAAMASVNASVFFIRPSYSKQASSPTKQGELMAMNVPVFCNTGVGDTDVLIERYKSGILIPEFSPEAYRSAIRQWQSTRGSSSAHLRQGAMLAFALRIGIERYNQVYLRVLNK